MPEEVYTKKEHESLILKVLGNSPKLRIIDFFLDNQFFDFTKKEVIDALGMSKKTFYKYFKDIENDGIVVVSRKIGKAKLYKLNKENLIVRLLKEMEMQLSLKIAEEAGITEFAKKKAALL